ncbi:small G protein signaling modulator 1-like isoform X2 [Sinocyclocheilus anshuiensis]|uniref:small G protein signaling modulator 1-like isoform X2 n=1 Tax=Sinocyclocheilus anshuiensis TaxID=1608454 RepID=UPI0007BACE83|nr:PREDICTED: small G protein signaling modulator 1-like isoform X2 [Sinocyclocheilus anshuiensis]
MATTAAETETRQRLLRNVKKEVKQIMEEAVTRKFVHEDSSHIVSFCAAVEACVLHGLKRRAAGFLRSNKIAALFAKVGKSFPPAEELCRKAQELELVFESKRSQSLSYSESTRKMPKVPNFSLQAVRHLWIHTALIEKVLDKIVLYLVENSSKFYEKEAILMDPVDGPILASLLVGPCALEYTKMKTADHFWTNPSADELVQRHRIHSGHCRQDSPTKRPALCIQKRHSSSSMDERPSPSPSARDYVESLHQNSRATLLFGKNNVLVQPRDDMEAIPGYLSLHQTADCMTLKWTPNQLMNGSMGDLEYERSVYWDYAMTIRLEEIVYLHCHQQVDCGGTVVLVSQDGIQRPPLRFPRGGHLLQFLSCLENGLLPHGQLDPPLWSQRGKGKVFPKLKKRCPQGSSDSVSDKEEEEATDYVFRIVFPNSQSEFVTFTQSSHLSLGTVLLARSISLNYRGLWPPKRQTLVMSKHHCSCPGESPSSSEPSLAPELIDQGINMWHPTPRKSSCSSCSRSSFSDGAPPNGCNHERAPLKLLCDNMKNQIISRAFYGWLAYCRLLSTVRTHLSGLVNHTIVEPDVPTDAYGGLTTEMWQKFLQDCTTYEEKELLRLVYFGGVEPSLRKEVWPFLLGHYQFGMSEAERKEVDEQMRACYEQTMSEWLGCEAIVRQREKEQHAVALAKCLSGASIDSTTQRIMHRDSTISNESSQSCSSGRQRDSRLQSDSSSGTQFFTSQNPFPWSSLLPFGLFFQVFESVEEVDQIESEPKSEDIKHVSKISNGTPQNGTSSPDSGHPSSRNFSVTSGQSDSLSTEDSGIHDPSLKAQLQLAVSKERFASSSGEEGKVTEEVETKSVEKLGVREYSKIEVNKVLSLDAVVTKSERSKKATESSEKRAEVKTGGLKTARDAFEAPAVARSHMTKMEVGESTERTLTSKNKALAQQTESDIPKATEVVELTPPEPKMNENRVNVDIERSQMGIKDIRAIQEKPLVTKDHKLSDALEQKVVAVTLVSVSKDGDTEKETAKTNEISQVKYSKTYMDDANNISGSQIALRPGDEKEKKTMKTSDLSNEAGTAVKRKAASVLSKTTGTEQREEKVVTMRTTHKEMQRNAPVVEEMVVPLVHEAFSTREMGEAQDATESDESPSAIEMEEIPTAKVSMAWERKSSPRSKGNEQAAVPVLELRLEEAHGKPSSDGMNSEEPEMESLCPQLDSLAVNTTDEATSPVSSIGTTYSQELLDMYSLNLHRIDKDVQRCDRNYWYFTPANLEKLRNIMCSYIWQHLEIGYVQGMCDLLAPLLVILDDEAMALSCFTELMTRMNQNFPHGGAMDTHFANMRSLIQILDAELFELMHQNGDYTHFYFCYRWFLLDFKRELVYDDVFAVWEAIWAAKCVSSSHFVLFIALALVEIYRDIILENNMDFTDIIKFFNEMAEHHNIKQILTLARDLVCKVQTLIENK